MADLSLMLQQLRQWSSDYVCVSDQASWRGNASLDQLGTQAYTSQFTHRCTTFRLPDIGLYRVFYFPKSLTRGSLPPDTQGWVNSADLLNKEQIRLWVYDSFGKVLPLKSCYIRGWGNTVFIAVDATCMTNILTGGIDTSGMKVTFWKNPHPENPIKVFSYLPVYDSTKRKFLTDRSDLDYQLSNVRGETYGSLYVNGYDVSLNYTSWTNNDYIELITESDVLGEFTVTIDDDKTGYMSDLYKDYREILHMPKRLNPDNLIILHDNIDIVIRDINTNQGLYLGRYDDRSVRQITHQDYSANRTDVDVLRDNLHASTIVADIRVRHPLKQYSLDKDCNYIKDLYRCDDTTIVRHLRGEIDSRFTFWKAQTLEQSNWLSLAFNNGQHSLSVPDSTVIYPKLLSDLDFYQQALGYYGTASILSSPIKTGYWDQSQLVTYLPPSLYNSDVYVYVFNNGLKISDKNITVTRKSLDTLQINLLNGPYPTQSDISIIVRDASGGPPIQYTLTSEQPTITTNTDDFLLYEQVNGVFSVINRDSTTWYMTSSQGQNEITFTSNYYNQSIYFVPRNVSQYGTIDINPALNNTESLNFVLNDIDGRPVLQGNHIDLFLNGHWLINGIDFVLLDDPLGKRLFINNKCFLDTKNKDNIVEWYITADYVVCDDIGYVVNNKLPLDKTPYIVEPQLSDVFIEGKLCTNYSDAGGYIATNNVVDCSASEAILTLPYVIEKILDNKHQEDDINRRSLINHYFNNDTINRKPKVITQQHSIYSTYLQQVINDLVRGTIRAVDDADDDTFIRQFEDPYNLRENDPALVKENLVNRDYAAVSATYSDAMPVSNQLTAKIVQRLITLLLVRPFATVGENYI